MGWEPNWEQPYSLLVQLQAWQVKAGGVVGWGRWYQSSSGKGKPVSPVFPPTKVHTMPTVLTLQLVLFKAALTTHPPLNVCLGNHGQGG